MSKIIFENSELYFQDFLIGTLSEEIEFRGIFEAAITENISKKHYAQVQSNDLILRFALKEKSPQFLEILQNSEPQNPEITKLLSNFGTLTVRNPDGQIMKICEAFWIRFPVPEFQLRRNQEKTIHSLYFLW